VPDTLVQLTSPSIPRNTGKPSPCLDPVAIHRAADKEVDEIYRHLDRLSGAALVIEEIATRICGDSFQDESKMLFLVRVLTDAADGILSANDRLCNAIDPLNPTVLDEVA